MIWVVLAVVAVVAVVLLVLARRPHQEPGVTSFRRHIDALSPEARREVMDRVRPPEDDTGNGNGKSKGNGTGPDQSPDADPEA